MTTTQSRCRSKHGRENCPTHGAGRANGVYPRSFDDVVAVRSMEVKDESLRADFISTIASLPRNPTELSVSESNAAVQDEIDGFEADWADIDEHIQFDVKIRGGKKELHVGLIYLPPQLRKQGFGSKMLEQITQTADKYGYVATLEPDDGFGMSKMMLGKIYGSHGFTWRDTSTMRRYPQD